MPVPLLSLSSTPNLITVILSAINSLSLNYPVSRLQQIQNSLARTVVKASKSCHITPILCSLHWLRITERIEYKLLSLTYKVLTTTNLHTFIASVISIQHPHITRSSSVITLARPPSSSLKVTDRSFHYASSCLWNQLPLSRHPHSGPFISDSPIPSPVTSSSSDSPLCTSITPSLLHSRLKTFLFHKSYPLVSLLPPGCLYGVLPGPFALSYSVFAFIFSLFFRFWAVH